MLCILLVLVLYFAILLLVPGCVRSNSPGQVCVVDPLRLAVVRSARPRVLRPDAASLLPGIRAAQVRKVHGPVQRHRILLAGQQFDFRMDQVMYSSLGGTLERQSLFFF